MVQSHYKSPIIQSHYTFPNVNSCMLYIPKEWKITIIEFVSFFYINIFPGWHQSNTIYFFISFGSFDTDIFMESLNLMLYLCCRTPSGGERSHYFLFGGILVLPDQDLCAEIFTAGSPILPGLDVWVQESDIFVRPFFNIVHERKF